MDMIVSLSAVAGLAAIATCIVILLKLDAPWLHPIAIVRATVQLGLLTVILGGVIESSGWVAVFIGAMLVAATWVVRTRLTLSWSRSLLILVVIAVAAGTPVALVIASGAIDPSPRDVLALGGIVIGNSMTVCTLMGRTLSAGQIAGRDEIEGWLALGASPRVAGSRIVRGAGSVSLMPSVDQTRTTGIVTLPGAFVGAIFAGASPGTAAVFQLLVLASILLAGAICVAALGWLFGAPRVLPIS